MFEVSKTRVQSEPKTCPKKKIIIIKGIIKSD
jgi:hypothetical protein